MNAPLNPKSAAPCAETPIIARNDGMSQGSYDSAAFAATRVAYCNRAEALLAAKSSPRDLLEEKIGRIEARDGEIQAFCHLDLEAARAAADASAARWADGKPLSPIDGCVIGIKDTVDVRGMPSKMNSDIFDDTPVRFDAACCWALRRAGAILIGKTWVPELAMGRVPPTRNPFDPARTAGGSSSGSGAAVGAEMVDAAIGNQTGGSLIRPSSYNAAYGFKPSHGALNLAGMHPLARSQDHIGPMARTLEDAWAIAWAITEAIGGHDAKPTLSGAADFPSPRRPQRMAMLMTSDWPVLDNATRKAFGRLVDLLKGQGVSIIDAHSDDALAGLEELLLDANEISNDIIQYEVRWPLVEYMEALGETILSETARARLARGLEMSPADYRRALARRDEIRALVARISAGVDGFVTLASSGPAPIFDETGSAVAGSHMKTGSRAFLSPWSMVGGPSISLPLLSVDGMPLGVQIMGEPGRDRSLVAIAAWLDEFCWPAA